MTRSIDERVTRLRFDDSRFKRGIKRTINSLNDLKTSLKFNNATGSISRVQGLLNKFSFRTMKTGLQGITNQFSVLESVAFTAIQNITNKFINSSQRMLSSFTFDPITAGFDDYGKKLNSVQTIMNATGKTIEDVSEYFDELDEYADKTVYNLDDMTSAMAKFVNAGIDLDMAVPAIKGIANSVALAGQGSQAASIAMYNLSQSLAGGFLTTIDYKSLNLANVATVEWKTRMAEAAVAAGTLKKVSNGLYSLQGGDEAVTTAALFNDELAEGWATTEVLLDVYGEYGDVMTDIGKKAQSAAQDVRDLPMLLETIRAAIGTTWTDTFELVIGNLEESKALFTGVANAISAFVERIADARNSALAFWKENEGRKDLLLGIAYILIGIADILEPLEDLFRKVFPPITGKTLVDITRKFKELAMQFKDSEGVIGKLKVVVVSLITALGPLGSIVGSIFTGLGIGLQYLGYGASALYDIASPYIFKGIEMLGNGLQLIADNIKPFGVSAFNATKKLYSFVSIISEGNTVTGLFGKGLGFLKSILVSIGTKITSVFKSMKLVMDSVGGADTNGFSEFIKTFNEALKSTGELGTKIVKTLSFVVGFIKATFGFIITIVKNIGSAFAGLGEIIRNSVKGADAGDLITIINSVIGTGILYSIMKLVKSLTSIPEVLAESLRSLFKVPEKIVNIIDSVKDALETFQTSLKANILLKIAISIAILAGAVYALSNIEPQKIIASLGAVVTILGSLLVSMNQVNKFAGRTGIIGITRLSVGLIGLSAAVLLLSLAVKSLSKVKPKEMLTGLSAVIVIIGSMVGAAKLMSNIDAPLIKMAVSMSIIGGALLIFAAAIKVFGMIKPNEFMVGLGTIAAILAGFALFTKYAKAKKDMISMGLLLLGISFALGRFGKVIKEIGELDPYTIAKGLGVVMASLAMMALVLKEIPANSVASGGAILLMSIALLTLSTSIKSIGSLDLFTIAKGMFAIIGVLAMMTLVIQTMPPTAVASAAAILLMGVALHTLIVPLATLGSMDLKTIGIGLLAIAGIFTVLGVAAYVLAPLTPIILGLAASLLMLGGAMILGGAGVALLGAGFALMAIGITTGGYAIIKIIEGLLEILPFAVEKIADAIGRALDALIVLAPKAGTFVRTIIVEIVKQLVIGIVELADTLLSGIMSLLELIAEYLPAFIKIGAQIVIALLDGLREYMPGVVDSAAMLLITFLESLGNNMGRIIAAGAEFVIKLINGIANGIRTYKEEIKQAIKNLISSIIGVTIEEFDAMVDTMKEKGTEIINGLVEGIKAAPGVVKDAIVNTAKAGVNAVTSFLKIKSPSRLFREIGKNIIAGLTGGIEKDGGNAVKATENVGKGVAGAANKAAKSNDKAIKDSNKAAKSAFEKAVEWIDERKYYNQLTLQEELDEWLKLQKEYEEGSEERKRIDREVYRVSNALVEEQYNHSVKWIDKKKYYNQLSLKEELDAWKRVQAKYDEGTKHRIAADREVYRAQKALLDKRYEIQVEFIERLKENSNLSLKREIELNRSIAKKYEESSKKRIETEKRINKLQKELAEKNKEYQEDVNDVYEDANDRRISLEEEYYDKTKEIKERTKQDILDLQKTYDDAVTSRQSTLYGTFGLFDEVEIVDPDRLKRERDTIESDIKTLQRKRQQYKTDSNEVKDIDNKIKELSKSLEQVNAKLIEGPELLKNLKSQVSAFELWQADIAKVTERGIDKGLVKELSDMGPKSHAQIKALLELSDKDLEQYVFLWKVKHKTAKNQAITELEDLRMETIAKIQETKSDSQKELVDYNKMWKQQLIDLREETNKSLDKLKSDWVLKVGNVRKGSEKEIDLLTTNIQNKINSVEWSTVGANMMVGMTNGIKLKKEELVSTAIGATKQVIKGVSDVAEIRSPSRVFMKIGSYIMEGLIIGIQNMTDKAYSTTSTIGGKIYEAVSGVMGDLDSDLTIRPLVTPVLDLSNINRGIGAMRGFNFGSVNVAEPNSLSDNTRTAGNVTVSQLVVREEADIHRVARELHKLQVDEDRG